MDKYSFELHPYKLSPKWLHILTKVLFMCANLQRLTLNCKRISFDYGEYGTLDADKSLLYSKDVDKCIGSIPALRLTVLHVYNLENASATKVVAKIITNSSETLQELTIKITSTSIKSFKEVAPLPKLRELTFTIDDDIEENRRLFLYKEEDIVQFLPKLRRLTVSTKLLF